MRTGELLRFIQQEKNISMEFVKQANVRGGGARGVYLYGAGVQKLHTVRFLQKHGVKILAILDTFQQGSYEGIPILRFEDFLLTDPDPESWFVISAPSVENEIRRTLERHFPAENIFLFETTPYVEWIPDVEEYRAYLVEHWGELSRLYDTLVDEQSKKTLINIIKGRISGKTDYFREIYVPDKYYPESILRLSKGEVWVEAGSYRGETLLDFLERCPDYKAAYCFEPDEDNLRILNETVEKVQKDGKIRIIPKGAWDSCTKLPIAKEDRGTSLSHVIEENGMEGSFIETATIDGTVSEPITYLKISTCCPELRILRGGQRQIVGNHPRISVCVSCGGGEILDLWNYLRELVPEYRFYLRHHLQHGGIESFLYAV